MKMITTMDLKPNLKFFMIGLAMSVLAVIPSTVSASVSFGPEDTQIKGSIKYSVIGKYKSYFEEFDGVIQLNEGRDAVASVVLSIKAGTITSNCGWCDKIVRSKQLLDVEQHPDIVFESSDIIPDGDRFLVKGLLKMHGISKEMSFPFDFKITEEDGQARLDLQGQWEINRKDFDIVWNRILDKGGVLVGNYITVDWGIQSDI